MAGEGTSEGLEQTNLEPDSKGTDAQRALSLRDEDPQAYELFMGELRTAFGIPSYESDTIEMLVAKVRQGSEPTLTDPTPSRSNLLRDALERILQAAEVVNNGDLQSRIDTLCLRLSGVGQPPKQESKITGLNGGTNAVGNFLTELLNQSDLTAPAAFEILATCMELAIFLIDKNTKYGDAALDPVRIMSQADPTEQIKVRLDDKLSRMYRGQAGDEDTMKDLVGYWVLLKIAEKRLAAPKPPPL